MSEVLKLPLPRIPLFIEFILDSADTIKPFREVLSHVYPQLNGTPLIDHAELVLRSVMPFSRKSDTPEQSKMLIRGGLMRDYMLSSQGVYEITKKQIAGLKQKYPTDDILTRQVIDHMQGGDVDVVLFLDAYFEIQNGTTRVVRENEENLVPAITEALYNSGFDQQTHTHSDGTTYQIKTTKIGLPDNPRMLISVVFTQGDRALEIGLSDCPYSSAEIEENIRFSNAFVSPDQVFAGEVIPDDNGLQIRSRSFIQSILYLNGIYTNVISSQAGRLFPELSDKSRLSEFVQTVRTAGSLSSLSVALSIISNMDQTYEEYLMGMSIGNHDEMNISSWIERNREQIEVDMIPVVTDLLFALAVNPLLTLPLLYNTRVLDFLPLGRIISSPENLKAVIEDIVSTGRQCGLTAQALSGKLSDLFTSYLCGNGFSGIELFAKAISNLSGNPNKLIEGGNPIEYLVSFLNPLGIPIGEQ